MINRKSQVEIQFNWIFILIVGAIILSFFVVIATRQKAASEEGINIGFFVNFEKALTGVSAVEGKTLLFEIPNLNLNYECTSGCDCVFYAGESLAKAQRTFQMNGKIIFAPNNLKGNYILTSSKEWSYPFRATNFLFITSPEVKYLIENTAQGQAIYDDLPPIFIELEQKEQRSFDKQLFDADAPIEGITGNYKVKFVFTSSNPEEFEIPTQILNLPDSDVTAVKIDTGANAAEKVSFYQKNGNRFSLIGDSYLFGDATEFASIFAEDKNAYSCMMNRAVKSLNMVARVYLEKQVKYSEQIGNFESLCDATGRCDDVILDCGINYEGLSIQDIVDKTSTFDFGVPGLDATAIKNDARSIEQQNGNAIEGGCPQVY